MGRFVLLALVVACGRIGFDDTHDGAVGGDRVTLAYPLENIDAVLATTVVTVSPVTSSGPLAFSVSPPLPAGLTIDAATGAITGTPTAVADNEAHAVTASNGASSATVTLYVTVLPGWVVDTVNDGADDNGGTDATCFSTAAGGCSLRAAVQTANRSTGARLVLLGVHTYTLGAALEPVMNDIQIAGAGPTLTHVRPTTIQPGFGFLQLTATHHAWLKDAAFDNFGSTDGPVVFETAGMLDVDECSFTNNSSAGSGGVLFINGGAHATFQHSTFTGNRSFGGNQWGGVIDGEDAGTTIRVATSTATLNQTGWGSFAHITTGTMLVLENSTLYDNTSTISGTLASPGGVYTLINDTIAYNKNTYPTPDDSTTSSAGIYLFNDPAHYTLVNTVLAFNTDINNAERNCTRRDPMTSLTSNGGNVFSDNGRNCMTYFMAAGDRFTTDPGIDPTGPTDHGGSTLTIALVPGSVSIDSGMNAMCPPTDQRGVARPVGATCDVGAFELAQ